MRLIAAIFLTCAPLASAVGSAGCPCLTSFVNYGMQDNAPLTATISGETYTYPANYGLSQCTAHDAGLTPYCDVLPAADRPGWCDDHWCYVDPQNCNLVTSQSAYFTDLMYSYGTCGQTNTFALWFGSGGTSHVLAELVTVASDYLKSIVDNLELTELELRQSNLDGVCKYRPSCRCCGCEENSAWSGPSTPNYITLQHTTTTPTPDSQVSAPNIDVCLSESLSASFQRIAAVEGDPSRVGYEYYGSQLGTYMQWPGIDWCPTTYDPRFRPWFAAGAAGPKDVIIVIDTSGSMSSGGARRRIEMAEEAASRVVDTLTESDYAAVVTFSSSAKSNTNTLTRMTTTAKATFQDWISSNVAAGGGTNYVAAFAKVWEILQASGSSTSFTSHCNRVVLFLSDGVPTSWSQSDYASTIASATLHNAHVITYALGSGADQAILKRLSCDNEGIFYSVADNDNLADVMAAYYNILSPMVEPCQVRFTEYEDWFTKKRLLGACLAAYKKADASTPSTCSRAVNTSSSVVNEVPHLIGVACLDISLLATNESLRANAGWADFEAAIDSARRACTRRTLSAAALEQLRTAVGPDAICSASDTSSVLTTSASYDTRGSQVEDCATGYPIGTDVGSRPTPTSIQTEVVLAGSVADFTSGVRDAIKAKVAGELSVSTSAISLAVIAASVKMTITVTLASAEAARSASSALAAKLTSTSAASTFLSTSSLAVTVESITVAPGVVGDEGGSSAGVVIAAAAAGALVAIAAGCAVFKMGQAKGRRAASTTTQPPACAVASNSVATASGISMATAVPVQGQLVQAVPVPMPAGQPVPMGQPVGYGGGVYPSNI